jgi:nitrogen-specific signal transduction histidine kinase
VGNAIESEPIAVRWDFAALLASRLAHDLSNIFTGVNGFAELALLQLANEHPSRPYVKDVVLAGQRGVDLAQGLHLLKTCVLPQSGPATIAAVLQQIEKRLRPHTPAGQNWRLTVPADLPPINMGPDPLYLVFHQLLNNAADAAGERGNIEVRCRPTELARAEIGQLFGRPRPGRHVEVQIIDDGPGVAPGLLQQVLGTPMGTSRPGRRGLGLAIVFRTLYANHGGFALEAGAAGGAVARAILPVA